MLKGIGHRASFYDQPYAHRWAHGGILRQKRRGRRHRPLSTAEPLHCVFKIHRKNSRIGLRSYKAFSLIQKLIKKYSKKFFVKIEQFSIQGDHIHMLVRVPRRSLNHSFFRVLAGQIAQEFIRQRWLVTDTPAEGSKLWKHRPFSRIVKGWKAYKIVQNYIRLNEKEALGEIPYRKQRLKGLSSTEWRLLWT
jgi:putative transposase